jgi:hypothetical protein
VRRQQRRIGDVIVATQAGSRVADLRGQCGGVSCMNAGDLNMYYQHLRLFVQGAAAFRGPCGRKRFGTVGETKSRSYACKHWCRQDAVCMHEHEPS